MRIYDLDDLGYTAAFVTIEGEAILLLDSNLSEDERVDVMLGAMKRLDA